MNRPGANMISRYLAPQDDLRVPLGEDVELDCSTSASETPQYSWLKEVIDILGTKMDVRNLQVAMIKNTFVSNTVAMGKGLADFLKMLFIYFL